MKEEGDHKSSRKAADVDEKVADLEVPPAVIAAAAHHHRYVLHLSSLSSVPANPKRKLYLLFSLSSEVHLGLERRHRTNFHPYPKAAG